MKLVWDKTARLLVNAVERFWKRRRELTRGFVLAKERSVATHGSTHRSSLQIVPPRRHQALPQRQPLRKPEVRHRTPQSASRHAHPPRQDDGIRRASAREAEAEALLRSLGAPVPPLLPARVALQ